MHKFPCKVCQENLSLVTLFDFPQPRVISEITSGRLDRSLDILEKNIFIVGGEKLYLQCELILTINDFDDELEMLVWATVEKKDHLPQIKKAEKTDKVILVGKLYHEIPFYEKSEGALVQIQVDLDGQYSDKPRVLKIDHEVLQKDFVDGIGLGQLELVLSRLHHEDV